MKERHLRALDPKILAAIDELESIVRNRYPDTQFAVATAPDEPESILVWATVDVDDPDEVVDLVLDRMLELQIDEGIPVHLVPVRTPERVLASRGSEASRRSGITRLVPRLADEHGT